MKSIFLEKELEYKGYRILTITDDGYLWVSSKYNIFKSIDRGRNFLFQANFNFNRIYGIVSNSRIIYRFLRGGFHDLVVFPDGTLVGIVPHWIVHAKANSNFFAPTFRIQRGTRPLNLAITQKGHLYFGEYFNNPKRKEVYIYASEDKGIHWEICYVFPKGTIRHVHRIIYDSYRKGLIILTGDEEKECQVLFTPDNFKTIDVLISGGQEVRFATAIPMPLGLILPTDTPLDQNYIKFLDNNGKLHKLCKLPGSSFYSCQVKSFYFISTGVEPSKFNKCRSATLWASKNGFDWEKIFEKKKDIWPSKLFQYGNIILPSGRNPSNYLFATTMALSRCDNVLHCWHLTFN